MVKLIQLIHQENELTNFPLIEEFQEKQIALQAKLNPNFSLKQNAKNEKMTINVIDLKYI